MVVKRVHLHLHRQLLLDRAGMIRVIHAPIPDGTGRIRLRPSHMREWVGVW